MGNEIFPENNLIYLESHAVGKVDYLGSLYLLNFTFLISCPSLCYISCHGLLKKRVLTLRIILKVFNIACSYEN